MNIGQVIRTHRKEKEYGKAEEYLHYFSDKDPMKKIYHGRLYMEQGEKDDAYKMFESVIFSEYQTLNTAFSLMTAMAIEDGDIREARYLAEKMAVDQLHGAAWNGDKQSKRPCECNMGWKGRTFQP